MSRDVHVRFCEQLGGKLPGLTRLVIGFENREDARRVFSTLPKRFSKYGLTIHPEKTRLLHFSPDNKGGSGTFDFLGFTHYWGKSKRGHWVIKRKTKRAKVKSGIQGIICLLQIQPPPASWRTVERIVSEDQGLLCLSCDTGELQVSAKDLPECSNVLV